MEFLSPVSQTSDHRRKLTHLIRADIKDVNYYEAKKGTVLGNHYHNKTEEYFFLTKGSCLVISGEKREVATKDSLFLIKPTIPHAIECLTDVNFLTFLTEPYDERNPDIHS